MFLVKKFHAKIAKILGDLFGHFEILHFQAKTAVATFVNIMTIFIQTSGHTDPRQRPV